MEKSPFPSYDKNAYEKLRSKEVRTKTLWSAPSSQEQKMLQAVTDSQLELGAENPQTLDLTWKTAQYFLKIQKFNQVEPLLKELVATIESHAQSSQSIDILSDAKKKLSEIAEAKNRPRYLMPSPTVLFPPRMRQPMQGTSKARVVTSPYMSYRIPNGYIESKSGIDYNNLDCSK